MTAPRTVKRADSKRRYLSTVPVERLLGAILMRRLGCRQHPQAATTRGEYGCVPVSTSLQVNEERQRQALWCW